MLMTLVGFMACNRTHQSEKQNQMLFNGANLAGWEVAIEADAELADATELFVVKNGLIRVAGDPFGYLYTVGSYSKYELSFEWRWVGEPTNSGVFIHVQNPGDVWPRAYEYQLMAGKAGDMVMLGGAKLKNYPCEGEFPIKPRVGDYENKAGAWNKGKIIVKGGEFWDFDPSANLP